MTRKQGIESEPVIMTIGHSTRSLEQLVELLHSNGVTMLVDVRTIPKSRTNPQFNSDTLAEMLSNEGIKYKHMPDLGGLRHAKASSPNTIWQNASFRGYADYMETDPFRKAMHKLLQLTQRNSVAIMCSEAVWWRCHRSMVADELVAEGVPVEHIMGGKDRQPHKIRSFAHVEDGHVSYR
ncbi:MAG: DUF488 domain-containing protein [Candidatus Obscuribacterales bacterium]|nr:DUF488 domain-containing protein [Candidatus Obscuribacterales bacterium]